MDRLTLMAVQIREELGLTSGRAIAKEMGNRGVTISYKSVERYLKKYDAEQQELEMESETIQ